MGGAGVGGVRSRFAVAMSCRGWWDGRRGASRTSYAAAHRAFVHGRAMILGVELLGALAAIGLTTRRPLPA
jgi:hypothetical protein